MQEVIKPKKGFNSFRNRWKNTTLVHFFEGWILIVINKKLNG